MGVVPVCCGGTWRAITLGTIAGNETDRFLVTHCQAQAQAQHRHRHRHMQILFLSHIGAVFRNSLALIPRSGLKRKLFQRTWFNKKYFKKCGHQRKYQSSVNRTPSPVGPVVVLTWLHGVLWNWRKGKPVPAAQVDHCTLHSTKLSLTTVADIITLGDHNVHSLVCKVVRSDWHMYARSFPHWIAKNLCHVLGKSTLQTLCSTMLLVPCTMFHEVCTTVYVPCPCHTDPASPLCIQHTMGNYWHAPYCYL